MLQIPLYPTAIFQSETDGEGMSFVLYFKLSDSHEKELPSHHQESIMVRFILNMCVGYCYRLSILTMLNSMGETACYTLTRALNSMNGRS